MAPIWPIIIVDPITTSQLLGWANLQKQTAKTESKKRTIYSKINLFQKLLNIVIMPLPISIV